MAVLVVYVLPYSFIKKNAVMFYFLSVIFMFLLKTPIGIETGSVRRWLGWNDKIYFRPSILMVFSTIVILGFMAEKTKELKYEGTLDFLKAFSLIIMKF